MTMHFCADGAIRDITRRHTLVVEQRPDPPAWVVTARAGQEQFDVAVYSSFLDAERCARRIAVRLNATRR